jgi:hypothetical protein
MDGTHLGKATEYFARIVWFPVETLRLRMTLPERLKAVPYPSVFTDSLSAITLDSLVQDTVLQFSPKSLEPFSWKRQSPSGLFEMGCFTNPYPQTWELVVPDPPLGSCYSLDWVLPEPPDNDISQKFAQGAGMLRSRFLKYARTRRYAHMTTAGSALRQEFNHLYADLHSTYGLKDADERFLVSMMTYDAAERRMVLVDAVVRGGEPEARMWNFRLPFGLGLAGSCFRQAQVFIYQRPQAKGLPLTADLYLPIPDGEPHECLLALPVDHPELDTKTIAKMPEGFERSQQCMGVINVASDHPMTKLRGITDPGEIRTIRELCQRHCDQMCSILDDSE